MVSQTDSVGRERVIVVTDANRNKGMVDALDWALKHVVRPKDTVIVIGVLCDIGKKNASCFPINMGTKISGIWEKLELSPGGHSEVDPREIGEEIERKREEFQAYLQPFCRQCKRNEVKLEVKLAAGLCPREVTVKEAQNSNTRWIVLDNRLKKHKLYIYGHVECNVAVMKGKDVATLMPSRAPKPENSPASYERTYDETCFDDQKNGNLNAVEVEESSVPPSWQSVPPSQGHCCYLLQWRAGFPQEFSFSEIEVITNGFTEEIFHTENIKVYEGVLRTAPVIVKAFQDDERFWSMFTILSRVRHRNIINIVGYCCTGTNRILIYDYPCLHTVAKNLQCDTYANNLSWKARWYTAIEIGGSLRYLHEECPNGPIVHQSVSSDNIAYFHGYSAMLGHFITAEWLKDDDDVPSNGNSIAKCPKSEVDKRLCVDVHDYGVLLMELITGKVATCFPQENEGQSLIDWVLPFLESGSVTEVMDPRLTDKDDDSRVVDYMAQAALLCLKNDSDGRLSISQVLAVVRGDQLGIQLS